MKSLLLALSFSALSTLTATAAFAEASYDDAGMTVNHDCGKDPEVSIVGASGTFTLTGACTQVSIDGSSNKVTIQSSDKVSISGSMNEVFVAAANKIAVVGSVNTVSWKKGLKNAKPKVSNVGSGNKISQAK